ncbi:alpha integrin [Knoellia flava TL1]|uniref:Fibronectin type-III domain-containing protein n=2 Tax=Knoellia flava TaxID=913969 RepID=A0A8H9FRJ4_9MICO|nr:FG-GAP-like repeat-containing protein [Knoellia flava]KGN29543.1 alpha integrin [Knoellia flava TL1]GGB75578.1 hypothetical protein GCM10011314_13910 [Knoellia flava]
MRMTLRHVLSSLAAACVGAGLFVAPADASTIADTTAPVLTRASLPAGTYGPAGERQAMTFTLDVADESPIKYVVIRHVHTDPSLRATPLNARWYGDDLDTTSLTWATSGWHINQAPLDGTYVASSVYVEDLAGNGAEYLSDGTVRYSSGARGQHTVDLRLTLVVAAGRDVTPPVLTSLWMPSQAVADHAGPDAYMSFDVIDPGLYSVTVHGRVNGGAETTFGWENALYGRQSGSILFRPQTLGEARVTRVELVDHNGNTSTFHADGQVVNKPGLGLPVSTSTHTVDLASQVTPIVAPTIQNARATAVSGSVTVTWSQPAFNSYRLTVQPGGRVITGAIDMDGRYQRTVTISGLPSGVAHTITITQVTQQGVDLDTVSVSVPAAPLPTRVMRVFGTGDRSRDGRADLWAAPAVTDPNATATWRIYQGSGTGGFGRTLTSSIPATRTPLPGSSTGRGPGAPLGALHLQGSDLVEPTATGSRVVGRGFHIFRTIDASSDLTGDGVADLIGITPAGDFHVYPSTATGAIGRGARLGGGWAAFHSVFSPGDFNGDRRSDVLAVDGLGKLWLYPGNGRGGFGSRVLIGSGWHTFGSVLPMRDFSGDGHVDIGAITADGRLFMYPGNGRGGFLTKRLIGSGWQVFLRAGAV